MFIDLHMHEKTCSLDSHLSLEEIVNIARERGLDAVCITDHDSMGLKEYAAEYSEKVGFPIFVGIEYYSLHGDIVAFGIDEYPKERIPAQEFIDLVKSQGGVCFCAHPYRVNNRGLKDMVREVRGMDGVEVLNGSTTPDKNQMAADDANLLGLAQMGSSDCHIPHKVGVYATWFPDGIRTLEDLIEAIRDRKCKPAYFDGTEYKVWESTKLNFEEAGVTPQDVLEYHQVAQKMYV